MNSTNRFLNRSFVLVVGLVLVLGGGAVAVGALLPEVQRAVASAADEARAPVTEALTGGLDWLPYAVAGVCLLLIALLVWFALRQGRGRTGTLLRMTAGENHATPTGGDVVIDAKAAEQVLEEALSRVPAIVAVDVSAFRVRRQNVLRITAHARRGASPMAVRAAVDSAVTRWDQLLGQQTPVVIQIVGGLRTKVAGSTRVA
ncbi:hypothetical protein ACEXQB_008815 [Herbiconiux sp. P18]|uniref:hypothetical protein n=1 Tax=Herbiconiux liangxiaofengii TaxID=3342795 RepID=UPI0035B9B563